MVADQLGYRHCHRKENMVHLGKWKLLLYWKLLNLYTVLTQHYAPFDYKPPPYYLHKFAAEVYLSPNYAPLGHTWNIY